MTGQLSHLCFLLATVRQAVVGPFQGVAPTMDTALSSEIGTCTERIFIELMMSDCKLKVYREGSKWRIYRPQRLDHTQWSTCRWKVNYKTVRARIWSWILVLTFNWNDLKPSSCSLFSFFFITLEPRVDWYKSLWALSTSPPWNCFTFLRSSCS